MINVYVSIKEYPLVSCMQSMYVCSMYKVCMQSRSEWWLDCADKLTAVVQQVIEFAKRLPGFAKLVQDDQIMLLKGGTATLFSVSGLCHVGCSFKVIAHISR